MPHVKGIMNFWDDHTNKVPLQKFGSESIIYQLSL